MITRDDFDSILAERETIIIDGALATELEYHGHDLSHPLWSGKILKSDPESIKRVHLSYYLAGADIAITASYQTSTLGLRDHFNTNEDEAADLIKRSVTLAQQARDEAYALLNGSYARKLLIAGSIGPYGAYLADGSEYRGDYQRSKAEFQSFHRHRIQILVESGVDLLAIETMPSCSEVEAVLELLQDARAMAWVSCTLHDSKHMSDGTPIVDLLELCSRFKNQVVAVGINCVPPGLVVETLKHMSTHTQLPPLCYPNSGESWNTETKKWSGTGFDENQLMQEVRNWRKAGGKLIGGCCRTGPGFIKIVSGVLEEDTK